MKKFVLLLFALAVAFSAGGAAAHPPSDLDLLYSREEGVLEVYAPHSVPDGKRHYINLFTLSLNGDLMYRLEPAWQVDGKAAAASFHVGDLPKGAVLEVEAVCNRAGNMKKNLTVE
ncbi:hypothetical protein SDC9_40027 [bioreactor metagenome]|uniref:Uncharacterized protein n=1 Tax=bioreactor metagenome TaxID=1076179 RepID=A0A644VR66_9ZZZZ|nr:hypothetical protein [Aminivibrio sp.]